MPRNKSADISDTVCHHDFTQVIRIGRGTDEQHREEETAVKQQAPQRESDKTFRRASSVHRAMRLDIDGSGRFLIVA
ncbi:hypothetical protein ACFQ9R_18220 [Nocardia sp. NPDC056541]|uniref:hypothetical protein n=1 Tax=unclassified Nocardia TaxID=2637762 RepID=UPI003671EC7B